MLNSIQDLLSKAFKENTKAQEALKKAGLYSKELKYGLISKENVNTLDEYSHIFNCSFKDLIGLYVLPIDDPILGLVAFNLKGEAIYTNDARTGVINSRALKVFDCIELAPNIIEYLKNPKQNVIPLINGEIYEGLSLALLDSNIETIELKDDKLLPELQALGQFSITIKGLKVFKGSREQDKPISHTEEEATFIFENYRYLVKGLRLISSTKLKVIVSVFHNTQVHTDKIDLFSFRSRRSFAKILNDDLGLQNGEEHLTKIQVWLEKLTKHKQEETKEIILSENDRKEAIEFLKQPNLIDLIKQDIEKIGYIGEDKNKLLAYLVATSRKLSSPLSAQIRSQSGSGKSFLMERVADLINPEDVLYFSRISPQSLYYMDKDGLANKLLVIDEVSGSDEAEYSIRTLQSRKKLSMAVVMKDPATGKQKTKFFEVLGPIAYFDSSTSYGNNENENRCFTISLDESETQTKLIMDAHKNKRSIRSHADISDTIKLHHNVQRILRPLKVIIPFVDKVKFPAYFLRARRDFDRFLSLIEASAFLHQYQRKIVTDSSGEYIEATINDYEIAYSLQSEVIETSLSELNPMCKDVYDLILLNLARLGKELGKDSQIIDFTRKEVRHWSMKPDHVIKRIMRELESLEYLSKRINGAGGKYVYRLTAIDITSQYQNNMLHPSELLA